MANYEASLAHINDAATSEYYVPPAGDAMSLETLQKNQQTLIAQIKLWNDRYNSGNSTERANITKILAIQNKKLSGYNTLIDVLNSSAQSEQAAQAGTTTDKASSIDETGTTVKPTTTKTVLPAVVTNNKKWFIIGGIVLAVIITGVVVYKLKHRKAG